MLLIAAACLVSGYSLLYAGVRGIHWRDPWRLLIGQPSSSAGSPAGAPGAPATMAPSSAQQQGLTVFGRPS